MKRVSISIDEETDIKLIELKDKGFNISALFRKWVNNEISGVVIESPMPEENFFSPSPADQERERQTKETARQRAASFKAIQEDPSKLIVPDLSQGNPNDGIDNEPQY